MLKNQELILISLKVKYRNWNITFSVLQQQQILQVQKYYFFNFMQLKYFSCENIRNLWQKDKYKTLHRQNWLRKKIIKAM